MTQVIERLTRRAQQLNDAQAEKALAFIEFLLAQERFEKERYEWHTASEEAFTRVWDNEHDAIYDNRMEYTESLWIKEVETRFKEIQDGTVICRPAEEVLRDAREKLQRE